MWRRSAHVKTRPASLGHSARAEGTATFVRQSGTRSGKEGNAPGITGLPLHIYREQTGAAAGHGDGGLIGDQYEVRTGNCDIYWPSAGCRVVRISGVAGGDTYTGCRHKAKRGL